jgi:hypothetical protein
MRRRPSPPAALAWALWALTLVGLAASAWLDHLLRRAGMPELTWFQATGIADVVAAVSAATVGAVLASRRPAHPVGWLLLGLGFSLAVAATVYAYVRYGLVARPGALPAAGYLAGLSNGMILIWISCVGFVLLLTPTGSLPSPRWRWWARVAAAAPVVWVLASVIDPAPMRPEYPTIGNPLAVPALPRVVLDAATGPAALVVVAAVIVGAASLVRRFRRARGTERQQLRWLALAAVLAAMALLVALAALVLDTGWDVFNPALGVCLVLLPLAIGAAILRYRLYDLDRIISRTLAYGLLTLLLGLGYAAVVLGLGLLLPNDSSLVVAAATLAVAALFQPARRRIQQAVDRRFNRRRYDAAHTIATFSARLREEIDLDTLTAELLAVVHQTVQPTRASLWLRRSPPGLALPRPRAPAHPGEAGDQHGADRQMHGDQHDRGHAVGEPARPDDRDGQRGAADERPPAGGPAAHQQRVHAPGGQSRQQRGHQHVGGADLAGVGALADGQLYVQQPGQRPDRQRDRDRGGHHACAPSHGQHRDSSCPVAACLQWTPRGARRGTAGGCDPPRRRLTVRTPWRCRAGW